MRSLRRLPLLGLLAIPAAFAQDGDGATTPEPTTTPAPAPATADTASAEKLLAKGTEADLIRVRGDLERLVGGSGAEDAWAWYLLGVAHYRLGTWEDAADAFSRATRLDGNLPMAWLGLGEAERMMGDVDTAVRRFDRGLDNTPDNGLLLEAKVRALRLSGRHDQAIEAAKDALKEHALQLGLYHEMGQAWLAKGNTALASFVFEKAETVPGGSEDAVVQADIGWTRYLLGESYAAKKRLERAVELDGSHLPALVGLARVRYDDRDYAAMVKTSSMRFAAVTSCCITRLTILVPSSISFEKRLKTHTSWPSNKRSIGPVVTHPSCAHWRTRLNRANK